MRKMHLFTIAAVLTIAVEALGFEQTPDMVIDRLSRNNKEFSYTYYRDYCGVDVWKGIIKERMWFDFYPKTWDMMEVEILTPDKFKKEVDQLRGLSPKTFEDSTKRIVYSGSYHPIILMELKNQGACFSMHVHKDFLDYNPDLVRVGIMFACEEAKAVFPPSTLKEDGEIKIFFEREREKYGWKHKERIMKEIILARMFPRFALGEVGPEHIGPMPDVRLSDDLDLLILEGKMPRKRDRGYDYGECPAQGFFIQTEYLIYVHWSSDPDLIGWAKIIGLLRHEGFHACFMYFHPTFINKLLDAVPEDDSYWLIDKWYREAYGELPDANKESLAWKRLVLEERIAHGIASNTVRNVYGEDVQYVFALGFNAGRGPHSDVWNKQLPRVLDYLIGDFPFFTKEKATEMIAAALKEQSEREKKEQDRRNQEREKERRAFEERRQREGDRINECLKAPFPSADSCMTFISLLTPKTQNGRCSNPRKAARW
jgi:hypothetical protein